MVHQQIAYFVFLAIMIPVCAVAIPIVFLLAVTHFWIAFSVVITAIFIASMKGLWNSGKEW